MEDTVASESTHLDPGSVEEELVLDSKGNAIPQKKNIPTSDPQKRGEKFSGGKADVRNIANSEFNQAKSKELDNASNSKIGEGANPDQKEDVTKQPEEQTKKKYKIKYNGKEEEVEVDDARIIEALQKDRDYTRKTQEAAEDRRQAESVFKLLENLKNDPQGIFEFAKQYLNHDLESMAEQKILEKLKYEMMDPSDRQHYDLTKENSSLKMELDKRRQLEEAATLEQRKAEEQVKQQQEEEKFTNEIGNFFDTKGIRPSNDQLISALELVHRYWDSPNPLTIEQAWDRIQVREKSERERLLKTLKPEDLSDEIKNSLRQADVNRIKTNRPWQNSKSEQPVQAPASRKTVTSEEYFREMEKQFKR